MPEGPADDYPYTDGTGSGLAGFCLWLGDQGLMHPRTSREMSGTAPRVLGCYDNWQTLDLRSLDIDRLIAQLHVSRASSLDPGTIATYAARFRKSVRQYLAYLDDPAGFQQAQAQAGAGWTLRGSRSPSPAAAADELAAAPVREVLTYPFPLRPSHVVWLRLPADFTRDDARRLVAFVETLVLDSDSQPPPAPAWKSHQQQWQGW